MGNVLSRKGREAGERKEGVKTKSNLKSGRVNQEGTPVNDMARGSIKVK